MWSVLKSQINCYSRFFAQLERNGVRHIVNNTTPVISPNLFLSPKEWKTLSPDVILQLHEERKYKLGPNYQPNIDELNALYMTSEYMGKPKPEIKREYESFWSNKNNNNSKNINNKTPKHIKIKKYTSTELKHGLRPFQFDDLPTPVQEEIEAKREERYYQRIAAYELPQLIKFRQEYNPINEETNPITYKYTSYLGEEHPNSKKVVLSCHTDKLGLDSKQLHKFRLLARTRYNYETDEFKMSSETFNEPLQNARYLHDILQKLIKEAKDLSQDTFEDIPLDTRHIKAQKLRKKKGSKSYQFPKEWNRPEDAPEKKINILKEIFS